MRRLLFAIGLVILAVVALSALGAPRQPDPTPTPARLAFEMPTRIPAPTATPGPPRPTNVAVDELRAAFEQTSALTSLKAEMVMSSTMDINPNAAMNLDIANHTLLTITGDRIHQYAEVVGGDAEYQQPPMEIIVIGSTGYVSNTAFSEVYGSSAVSTTTEPASGWLIMPREQSAAISSTPMWPEMLGQFVDPEHDLPLLVLEGHEELGGVACDRYFTDQAAARWAEGMQNMGMGFTRRSLTIWHCADGTIRRIEAAANLESSQNSEAGARTAMWMELLESPTSAVIEAPPNPRPMER
ncbi:MAG TPA: hypothetical protein VD886_16920 [Herpetosiphonaceae bacterium]|nr:hypothetical protein [Herpetosiphonaceae bacterium]